MQIYIHICITAETLQCMMNHLHLLNLIAHEIFLLTLNHQSETVITFGGYSWQSQAHLVLLQ